VQEFLNSGQPIFRAAVSGDAVWEKYLASFPKGADPLYVTRSEHDCSTCKHFIRGAGNLVTIQNGALHSIWDIPACVLDDPVYAGVCNKLAIFVEDHFGVSDLFRTAMPQYGAGITHGLDKRTGQVREWCHFVAKIPSKFIMPERAMNEFLSDARTTRQVFERSITEISEEAVDTVLELIAQGALYKGAEWQTALAQLRAEQRQYEVHEDMGATENDLDALFWEKSVALGPVVGRIRNHSIGMLLQAITAGIDLDEAVKAYEAIVAPSNYKRPKAIFTKAMVAQARLQIEELGLATALDRRYARVEDISVNDILFVSRGTAPRLSTADSPFNTLMDGAQTKPKVFKRVTEIGIEAFLQEVLPDAKKLELVLEPHHKANLMSLIAPQVAGSPSLFKWPNGFSWAYSGNITDSMKQRVKSLGGRVDAELRFSIEWNDKGDNNDDLDVHCVESSGEHIYFCNKGRIHQSSGMLDVDIVCPNEQVPGASAVENITWTDRKCMPPGDYDLYVHCYRKRGGTSGFKAEVEFDGVVHEFYYDAPMRHGENVAVAMISLSKDREFSIKPKLSCSGAISEATWGLKIGEFTPVTIMMASPNHWDGQPPVGNKHWFFMLAGAENPEEPNGFFNEFLREDLMKHKRVFEALGSAMKVKSTPDQLSGVGFSATKRDSIVCKVTGTSTRTIKINF